MTLVAAARAGRTGRRRFRWLSALSFHAVLIAVSLVFLLPFYWMVVAALKTNAQIFAFPIQWWPDPPSWSNFSRALNYPGFPFMRQLLNSIGYSAAVALGTVVSCASVGYSFACLRWRGRDTLFAVTIATLLVPAIVTFLPTYILFAKAGLTGTYVPLIVPAFLGNAFFIFMMRQFFRGVGRELLDAARLDGASEFRIFWQIVLPQVRPALVVVAVFAVLYTWHEFFGPLVYLQDPQTFPLSLGLFAFRSQRTAEWALSMTGALLTTVPMIVLFLFTQRAFLRGVTMGKLR